MRPKWVAAGTSPDVEQTADAHSPHTDQDLLRARPGLGDVLDPELLWGTELVNDRRFHVDDCLVPRHGRGVTLQELVTFLTDSGLARFKLPERLELVDDLPLSKFGKVAKNKLSEIAAAKVAGSLAKPDLTGVPKSGLSPAAPTSSSPMTLCVVLWCRMRMAGPPKLAFAAQLHLRFLRKQASPEIGSPTVRIQPG